MFEKKESVLTESGVVREGVSGEIDIGFKFLARLSHCLLNDQ